MPWTKGKVTSYEELIEKIISYVTDKSIHGSDAWELMRSEAWPKGTILKCPGLAGSDHFYIGLMPLDIVKGKTYRDWFMKKENLATNFIWSERGLNKLLPFSVSGNTATLVIDKEVVNYSFSLLDIFAYSAKVLYFGVFKQYQEGLDWHEQPGGMEFANTPLMTVEYSVNGELPIEWRPPMFPGAGYPAISMDPSGPIAGDITYYLIKSRRRLIVVTNNFEHWDSAYAGFLDPYAKNIENAFPAAVIGSTGYTSFGETRPILNPVIGPMFDYRPNNWDFSHGIAPFASSPLDNPNALTQCMLMTPDGLWKSFASYIQTMSAVPYEHGVGWYYVREKPSRPKNIKRFIRPTEADLWEFYKVYNTTEDPTIKTTYQLEPIEFIEAEENEKKNVIGKLTGMYYPCYPIRRYGEAVIGGKKHLVLPNVWEGRKYYLQYYVGHCKYYGPDQLLMDDRELEKLSRVMNVVIEMEE